MEVIHSDFSSLLFFNHFQWDWREKNLNLRTREQVAHFQDLEIFCAFAVQVYMSLSLQCLQRFLALFFGFRCTYFWVVNLRTLNLHYLKMCCLILFIILSFFLSDYFSGHLPRMHACSVASAVSDSLWPRLLCPWHFPGKNTGVGYHVLLQGLFPTQGLNPPLLHSRWIHYVWATGEACGHLPYTICICIRMYTV